MKLNRKCAIPPKILSNNQRQEEWFYAKFAFWNSSTVIRMSYILHVDVLETWGMSIELVLSTGFH